MVKLISKEVILTVGDDDAVVTDGNSTLAVERFEGNVFLTKLDADGKHVWILSEELAQKLKDAI